MIIFSKTYKAEQADKPSGVDNHQLGSAARRSLDALLSELYQRSTQEWLGRHLGTARYDENMLLTNMSGAQEAQHSATFKNQQCICFTRDGMRSSESEQVFDFVYTRIWAGDLAGFEDHLTAIHQNLNKDGILLLEILPLSGISAYPYNHALARTMELIGQIERPASGAATIQERIQIQLHKAGFNSLDLACSLPAFISPNHNRIISLALEAFLDAMLHCRGSTKEELNALLTELKSFERQGDILISRPGMWQVLARKQEIITAK